MSSEPRPELQLVVTPVIMDRRGDAAVLDRIETEEDLIDTGWEDLGCGCCTHMYYYVCAEPELAPGSVLLTETGEILQLVTEENPVWEIYGNSNDSERVGYASHFDEDDYPMIVLKRADAKQMLTPDDEIKWNEFRAEALLILSAASKPGAVSPEAGETAYGLEH